MVELKFQMKAILVLLFATSAMANHLHNMPPVTSIVFTIFYAALSVLHVIWLVKLKRRKVDATPLTVEKQSLVNSTMPEEVVASNINVTDKSRPSLLREIRRDELLAWAHETASPMVFSVLFFVGFATFLSVSVFAVALSFSIIIRGSFDVVFLSLYIPVLFFIGMVDLSAFLISRKVANSVIFAVTNKRLLIFSAVNRVKCCGGRVETVRAYDLDGIHQTTLTRKDDGSGTLTFSINGAVDEGYGHHHHQHHSYLSAFAFINIPNVTAVKDLIEQYKALRKKQGGNQ